jgi:hypothetical protein
MPKEISDQRKTAYYLGAVISIVGLLLFLSVLVGGAMNFGNFDDFHGRARSSAIRAVAGMVLIITGQAIRSVGARGLAGSGVVLNPSRAREELKPYSNMAGGMLGDALDASNLSDHLGGSGGETGPIVMIKCLSCGKLNEEDSNFCQECGASMGPNLNE